MGAIVTGDGDDRDYYYSNDTNKSAEDEWYAPIILLGIIGAAAAAAYTVNKQDLDKNDMGEGRILNNAQKIFFHRVDPYQDVEEKDPYFRRMYRTHNITYPDIMYEGVTKQLPPINDFVNMPIPPSDLTHTQLAYAEPSNIVTDSILYEQGIPDIREDLRITKELPSRGAGGNTITTEYAPGLSEKIRRDNPVVVSKPLVAPDGRVVRKVGRLKPIEKRHKRRFNTDYDEFGRPLQIESPIYDTMDYLKDLRLTNEDYGEGRPGTQMSYDDMAVWEDFIIKGKLREGYEIIPSED